MTDQALRAPTLAIGVRLAWFTVLYNILEGIVTFVAGIVAGSPALVGFSFDSAVESISGGIILWRLDAEQRRKLEPEALERIEKRALQLVAVTLVLAAAYIAVESIRALASGERPDPSPVGIGMAAMSVVVMPWLARRKRRAAAELGSAAMHSESSQTLACTYLSASLIIGLGLNAVLGWWWADPVSALVIAGFLVREGREAWNADPCCGV